MDEIAVSASLDNLLPVFGVARLSPDGHCHLYSVYDYRDAYLLRELLANLNGKVYIQAASSKYLQQLVQSFEHTSVPSSLVLPSVPDQFRYVENSFETHCSTALKLMMTLTTREIKLVTFMSQINAEFTTVNQMVLEAINVFPNVKSKDHLSKMLDGTLTPMGQRLLLGPILRHPLISIDAIRMRQKLVDDIGEQQCTELGNLLRRLPDLDKLLVRLHHVPFVSAEKRCNLIPIVYHFYEAFGILHRIKTLIEQSAANKIVGELVEIINQTDKLYQLLVQVLDFSKIQAGNNAGILKCGVDSPFYQLYAEQEAINSEIEQLKQKLSTVTRSTVKIMIVSPDQWLLRLPKNVKVPDGAQLYKINKAETLFTTQEFNELTEKLNAHSKKIVNEEREYIEKIFKLLLSFVPNLDRVTNLIGLIDILRGWHIKYRIISQPERTWNYPELSSDGTIKLLCGLHPFLLLQKQNFNEAHKCVPNDYVASVTERNCLLTGPNMGGKSTYSRQQILLLLLAQYGMKIPVAKESVVTPTVVFGTRIGGSDNPCRNLSTFMLEASETAGLIHSVTAASRAFLIIDELGRGTSVEDGSIFASGILNYFASLPNVYVLAATHFHEIIPNLKYPFKFVRFGSPYFPETRFKALEGIETGTAVTELLEELGYPKEIIKGLKQTVSALSSKV